MHRLTSMILIAIFFGTGALSAPVTARHNNDVVYDKAQPDVCHSQGSATQSHSYAAAPPLSNETDRTDYKSEYTTKSEAKTEHAIAKESKSESLVAESREDSRTNSSGPGARKGMEKETKIEYAVQSNKTSDYMIQNANKTEHAVKEGYRIVNQPRPQGVEYRIRHDSKNQTHIADFVKADETIEYAEGEDCDEDELSESHGCKGRTGNRAPIPYRLRRTTHAEADDDTSGTLEAETLLGEDADYGESEGITELAGHQVSASTSTTPPNTPEDRSQAATPHPNDTPSATHEGEQEDDDDDEDEEDDDDNSDDDDDDDDVREEYARPPYGLYPPGLAPGYRPPYSYGGAPPRANPAATSGPRVFDPLSLVSVNSGGRPARLVRRSKGRASSHHDAHHDAHHNTHHGTQSVKHDGYGHKPRHPKHRHGRLIHNGYY